MLRLAPLLSLRDDVLPAAAALDGRTRHVLPLPAAAAAAAAAHAHAGSSHDTHNSSNKSNNNNDNDSSNVSVNTGNAAAREDEVVVEEEEEEEELPHTFRVVGRERGGIVLVARTADRRGRPPAKSSDTSTNLPRPSAPSQLLTRIEVYDVATKKLATVFALPHSVKGNETQTEIVCASLSEDRTLLAFTTVGRFTQAKASSGTSSSSLSASTTTTLKPANVSPGSNEPHSFSSPASSSSSGSNAGGNDSAYSSGTFSYSLVYESFIVELGVVPDLSGMEFNNAACSSYDDENSARIFPLNIKTRNQAQRIQFLTYNRDDAHKLRCVPFFLFMCQGEFIRVYKVPCKPRGGHRFGVRLTGNPQACKPTLAVAPVWCEYDPILGLLYALVPDASGEDGGNPHDCTHILQCHSFNDRKTLLSDKAEKEPVKKFEITINLPLSPRAAATRLNRAFLFSFHADTALVAPECDGGGWITVVHLRSSDGPPVACLCLQHPQSRHEAPRKIGESEFVPTIDVSIVMLHHRHRLDFRIPLPPQLDVAVRRRTRVLFGSVADMLIAYVPGHFLQLVDCGGDHGPMLSLGGTGQVFAPALPHSSTYVDAPLTAFDISRYSSANSLRRAELAGSTTGGFMPQEMHALDCRHGIVYRIGISIPGLLDLFRDTGADVSRPLVRSSPSTLLRDSVRWRSRQNSSVGDSSTGGEGSSPNSGDDESSDAVKRSNLRRKLKLPEQSLLPDVMLTQAVHLVAVHMRDVNALERLMKLAASRLPAPSTTASVPAALAEYIVGLTYAELIKRVVAVTTTTEPGLDGPAPITGAMLKCLPVSTLLPWRVPAVYRARFGARFVGPQRPGWSQVPGTKQPTREHDDERERFILAAAAMTEAVASAELTAQSRSGKRHTSYGDIDDDEDLLTKSDQTRNINVADPQDSLSGPNRSIIISSPALSGTSTGGSSFASSRTESFGGDDADDLWLFTDDSPDGGPHEIARTALLGDGRVVKQPPPPFHRNVSRHFHSNHHHDSQRGGPSGAFFAGNIGAAAFAQAYTARGKGFASPSSELDSGATFAQASIYAPSTPLVRQPSIRATAISAAAVRSGSLRHRSPTTTTALGHHHGGGIAGAHYALGLGAHTDRTPPPGVKRFLKDLLGLGDEDEPELSPRRHGPGRWTSESANNLAMIGASPRSLVAGPSGSQDVSAKGSREWTTSSAISIDRSRLSAKSSPALQASQSASNFGESAPAHHGGVASRRYQLDMHAPASLPVRSRRESDPITLDSDSGMESDSSRRTAPVLSSNYDLNQQTQHEQELHQQQQRRTGLTGMPTARILLPPVASPPFFDTFDEREDRLGRSWLIERLTAHLCQRFPKTSDRGMCQAIAKEFVNLRGLVVEELYHILLQSIPVFAADANRVDLSEHIRFHQHQNLFAALEMLECPAPPGFWAQFVRSGVGAVRSREVFIEHVRRGSFVVDPRLVEATCIGNLQSGGAFERARHMRFSLAPSDTWFKQELLATVANASLRHRLMHALPEHQKYLLHHALDNLPDVLSVAAAGQRYAKQMEEINRRRGLAAAEGTLQQRVPVFASASGALSTPASVKQSTPFSAGFSASSAAAMAAAAHPSRANAGSVNSPTVTMRPVPPGPVGPRSNPSPPGVLDRDIANVWRDLLRVGSDGGFLDMEVAHESPFIPLSVFLSALPLPVDRGEGTGNIAASSFKAAKVASAVYDAPIVHFIVQQAQRLFENQFGLPFTSVSESDLRQASAATRAELRSSASLAAAVTDVGMIAGSTQHHKRLLGGPSTHGDNTHLPVLRSHRSMGSSNYIGDDGVSSSEGGSFVFVDSGREEKNRKDFHELSPSPAFQYDSVAGNSANPSESFVSVDLSESDDREQDEPDTLGFTFSPESNPNQNFPAGLASALRGAADTNFLSIAEGDWAALSSWLQIKLPLSEKSFMGRRYEHVFTGSELVRWLRENVALSQPAARQVGSVLLERQIIKHCSLDVIPFTEICYYRFKEAGNRL